MTCTSNESGFLTWRNPVPISFSEWKSTLLKLSSKETTKLSSTSDHHHPHRSSTQIKKQDRSSLPRNQVFGETVVDSFLVSSTSNIIQSSLGIVQPDVPKILSPPTKRYVSSFKTLVNSTNNKQPQRLNYINDSVVIFKLSKEHASDNSLSHSQSPSKQSTSSTASNTTLMSAKSQQQHSLLPPKLSPILKIEGQKRRIVQHDSSITTASNIETSVVSQSANPMATSTSSHPQTNSSVFIYRSAAAGGNAVRQRAIAESASNSLLISAERLKSNLTSSIRQTRQSSTTLSSLSSQQIQRNSNTKTRVQQEKSVYSKETYDYPDPFTNCPQDVLNKLAQLTKLQLETIEWEKKRRFTKKKPLTNGPAQGKDSP